MSVVSGTVQSSVVQPFQAGSRPARIQVLGLYEANSLRFDHLWVLGLHNDNWPPAARPNPFIPRSLQQQHGLPHSNPARELEVAKTITNRLLETAGETVFSYPGQADGESLLPSPLLQAAGVAEQQQAPGWDDPDFQDTLASAPGPHHDTITPPGPLRAEQARGGSSILIEASKVTISTGGFDHSGGALKGKAGGLVKVNS